MCSDAANGEYEDFKIKDEAGCAINGDVTTSESKLHLNDVLEMLIRLDQQGHFMNRVVDSLASDYTPMCFLTMQEKVYAEQYPSWTSFVEDFESICHTAMKNNQECSEIWNAANSLLRQGRRCLEQHSLREATNLGTDPKVHDHVNAQDAVSRKKLEHHEATSPGVFAAKPGNACLVECATGNLVPVSAEGRVSHIITSELDMNEVGEELENAISDKFQSLHSQLLSKKGVKENVMVDILELSPGEDIRLKSDKQAIECSSSFGDTQNDVTDDEVDGQSCEVESELRNGNGAKELAEEIPSPKRKKKALNLEWKTYRQGIEWRCRWLELHVKELQTMSKKYNQILETARSEKKQQEEQEDILSARTSAIFGGSRSRALQRQQRRKEEENVDSKSHMSKHPVFSRYEKKQQRSQEELATEEMIRDESYQILEFDDFNPDVDYGFGDDFPVEEDSVEQYRWHIEALQLHICRLKNMLTRGTLDHRNAVASPGGLAQLSLYDTHTLMHSPGRLGPRSVLGGSKPQGGKSIARRGNSDFDINNVIMPDNVMATYIEPVRHAFIETPHWRMLGDVSVSARGGSSEEDTDDEVYRKLHVEMQVKEHQEQYAPWNKSRNVAYGREQTESTVAEKDLVVNTIDEDLLENVQDFPTSFGFVPKRKRRRRESRDIASIAKNIEPLLNASQKHVSELGEPSDPNEDRDCQKSSSTE